MNKIWSLYNSQGEVIQSKNQIQEELINYFQDLLTEPEPNKREAIWKITQHIPHMVSDEQNVALLWPISKEEVDKAMMQTLEGKSPRPDGFTADFFTTIGLS